MIRHVLILVCVALTLGLFLTACQTGGPVVTVYVTVDQPFAEPVLASFTAKTGVTVQPVFDTEAAKTVGLANRLRAERARPLCDVFWSSEFAHTVRLADEGLFEAREWPTATGLPAELCDPGRRWVGFGLRARVLLVNTKALAAASMPTRLADLLDPAWKPGEVAIGLPLFGTTNTHAAALYAMEGEAGMLDFFETLKARGAAIVDGNAVVRDRVAAGACLVGLTDTDDALVSVARGDPVKMILPDQEPGGSGTLLIPNTVAVVAGAPHAREAAMLADYLASVEVEKMLADGESKQISARRGGPVPAGLPAPDSLRPLPVSLASVAAAIPSATILLRDRFMR
ncbi:MAG TPA: extracellular solute-binding protein [Candidatus Ozemobacteraceae bacterium]|nr:extracellular solute-binding protein [Candidatus Ozemobacteraceae bacterium]